MKELLIGFLFGFLLTTAIVKGCSDDSDNDSDSSITTYLDHQTGCSYLISPNGSLTPRLDTDGLPICDAVMILDSTADHNEQCLDENLEWQQCVKEKE